MERVPWPCLQRTKRRPDPHEARNHGWSQELLGAKRKLDPYMDRSRSLAAQGRQAPISISSDEDEYPDPDRRPLVSGCVTGRIPVRWPHQVTAWRLSQASLHSSPPSTFGRRKKLEEPKEEPKAELKEESLELTEEMKAEMKVELKDELNVELKDELKEERAIVDPYF